MLEHKIKLPLIALRLGVFITLAVWVADKFINPDHTAAVWARYYNVENIGVIMSYLAGTVQACAVIGFLLGFAKRYTYGFVLLMQLMGTLAPISKYLAPYEGVNILFFAAWPMLAACITLYILRDYDTYLSPFSKEITPTGSRALPDLTPA